jgi:hypothetical protein
MQSSLLRDSSRSTRFRPQLTELESRITPVVAYALSDNRLIAFDTSNPAAASAPLAITGVNSSETLVGIDVRPQNGMLYGLGYNPNIGTVQLYLINNTNGVATPVGATGQFQSAGGTPMRVGVNANSRIDLDFNPAADRLRVVVSNGGATGGGQNFRINPNNGQFIDGDFGGPGTVAGLNMDGEIKGATFTVQGTAYTNNFPNTGAVTTQYTLDDVSSQIAIQNPPNSGTQTAAQTRYSSLRVQPRHLRRLRHRLERRRARDERGGDLRDCLRLRQRLRQYLPADHDLPPDRPDDRHRDQPRPDSRRAASSESRSAATATQCRPVRHAHDRLGAQRHDDATRPLQ